MCASPVNTTAPPDAEAGVMLMARPAATVDARTALRRIAFNAFSSLRSSGPIFRPSYDGVHRRGLQPASNHAATGPAACRPDQIPHVYAPHPVAPPTENGTFTLRCLPFLPTTT